MCMWYDRFKKGEFLSYNWQDGRVGLRRTVQVNLIPMVQINCLRVSKGAWVQIPLLSYIFVVFASRGIDDTFQVSLFWLQEIS
ncbi:hypothetical protein N7535_003214 [Penicillium sp. DV-2018c]|nr:hypothetical protein N7461_001095 [Penicillium sp. DV-2018c]KAJ5576288.1 hypothetical protein N7535_003214 [Penicillium sp. DV-2018c]